LKLLKFSAAWCQPCKQLDKLLEPLMGKYPDIELVNTFIEENPDLASYYNIRTIPTMIMIDNNEQVLRTMIGFKPKEVEPFLGYIEPNLG
jgi:thioredoxin 1